jgi:hypothetical protein
MIRSWVLGADLQGSEVWAAVGLVITGTASAWQVPGLGRFSGEAGCGTAG